MQVVSTASTSLGAVVSWLLGATTCRWFCGTGLKERSWGSLILAMSQMSSRYVMFTLDHDYHYSLYKASGHMM